MEKDEAKVAHENFKLEICKKMLSSDLLERRIVGIKELNTIVRAAQMVYAGSSVFTIK